MQLICWSLCIIWNRRKNNLDICSAILASSIILIKTKIPKDIVIFLLQMKLACWPLICWENSKDFCLNSPLKSLKEMPSGYNGNNRAGISENLLFHQKSKENTRKNKLFQTVVGAKCCNNLRRLYLRKINWVCEFKQLVLWHVYLPIPFPYQSSVIALRANNFVAIMVVRKTSIL